MGIQGNCCSLSNALCKKTEQHCSLFHILPITIVEIDSTPPCRGGSLSGCHARCSSDERVVVHGILTMSHLKAWTAYKKMFVAVNLTFGNIVLIYSLTNIVAV